MILNNVDLVVVALVVILGSLFRFRWSPRNQVYIICYTSKIKGFVLFFLKRALYMTLSLYLCVHIVYTVYRHTVCMFVYVYIHIYTKCREKRKEKENLSQKVVRKINFPLCPQQIYPTLTIYHFLLNNHQICLHSISDLIFYKIICTFSSP